MPDHTTTLRRILTQQKSFVPCSTTATRNTFAPIWPQLEKPIAIWDDFNLNNLSDSYGHVLDLEFSESLLKCPRPNEALGGVVIGTSTDINHLTSWNDGLMQPTLQFAKSHLRLYPGVILRHRCSTADRSALASIPNGAKRLAVDHVISLDDFPGTNLVVGLGRPSSKWSGRTLANHLVQPTLELLNPLRQLANLCKTAGTRYGYIQTNEELVACCFSDLGGCFKAAIMPIPWTRYGVDVLTTDLALWWLTMLAMSGQHHRAIVSEREMVRICDWDVVYVDEERGWVRRHRYSNVEKPTSPPQPPSNGVPSLGNVTAPTVGVGLDVSAWFNIDDPAGDSFVTVFGFSAADFDDPHAASFP